MTLILSCMTPDSLVVVADMRLVRNTAQGTIPTEEHACKMVLFEQHFVCAYTGLAAIGRFPTDDWLANILIGPPTRPLPVLCKTIADKASVAFRGIPIPSPHKRHEFVITGWVQLGTPGPVTGLRPIVIVISNIRDGDGTLASITNDAFVVWFGVLPEDMSFRLFHFGRPLRNELTADIEKRLEICVQGDRGSRAIEWILINAIRQQAQCEDTVGRNLLSASIPRVAIEPDVVRFSRASAREDLATFRYIADGDSEGVPYGPHVISQDVQFSATNISDFRILRGERAREQAESLPAGRPFSTFVLSPWTGLGISSSKRRASIVDDFELSECTDVTAAPAWGGLEKCPYYGLLVGIRAAPETVRAIRQDARYLVVASEDAGLNMSPPASWFSELRSWLTVNGMPPESARAFANRIVASNRGHVIEELKHLLRTRKQ